MIEEIRRENLADLANSCGSAKALADILGRSESQVSQWINGSAHSATGKPRGMRSETARMIEKKCGKPMGWLDIDHRQPGPTTISALTLPMFAIRCAKCGKVSHKSFIELESSNTVTCAACGSDIVVADYYGIAELETILKGFSGEGFSLRKR